jgi:hypothetical protein
MNLRSRRLAVTLALCAAGADTLLLWPRTAAASAPVATASWQVVTQDTPLGVLPSTSTPGSHDLTVQNSPVGVLAFSAVRYDAQGATSGLLTLSLSGQQPTNPPAIDLCRITSSWRAGVGQPWNARPTYDCAHAVIGSGNPSQMTWEIGPALLRSGRLDVALVPDPSDPTPYAVTFAAPDAGSFDAVQELPSNPPSAGHGGASGAGRSSADVGGNAGQPAAVPSLGSTTVSSGPAAQPPAVAAPAGTPASSAQPAAVAARGPASRALGAGALALFALVLLLRSFVSVGSKGRVPRSLLPTPSGEA